MTHVNVLALHFVCVSARVQLHKVSCIMLVLCCVPVESSDQRRHAIGLIRLYTTISLTK